MHRLSLLVLGHRGKLRKLEASLQHDDLVLQLMCLRLAVILCHARRAPDLQGMVLARGDDHSFRLRCRNGWAAAFPQSAHLLQEEVQLWQKTPWSLALVGV